jgi:DNA-binding beta-propeller fold protein YncE
VSAGVVRVAAGFGALWVTGTTDTVTRVVPASDPGTPTERTVTVGEGPIGVATGAGAVWVANAQSGSVSKVDPTTLHVDEIAGVGHDPLSVGVGAGRVYVGFGTGQTVRTVAPAPASKVLDLHTDPRQIIGTRSGVWMAGANPGRVIAVTPG